MLMQEPMIAINLPGLLLLGYLIAAILIYLGSREPKDSPRKYRFLWFGFLYLGLLVIATPFSWYAYQIVTQGSVRMEIPDLFIVTLFSVMGGCIFGYMQNLDDS